MNVPSWALEEEEEVPPPRPPRPQSSSSFAPASSSSSLPSSSSSSPAFTSSSSSSSRNQRSNNPYAESNDGYREPDWVRADGDGSAGDVERPGPSSPEAKKTPTRATTTTTTSPPPRRPPLTCNSFFVYFVFASLNITDLVLALCLALFAYYFADVVGAFTRPVPVYVTWISCAYAVLAGFIAVEVLFSVVALASSKCTCLACIPQHMTYVIAAASFVAGLFGFLLEHAAFEYLNTTHSISKHVLENAKSYYQYAAGIALGAVPPIQGLRYCLGITFQLTGDGDGGAGSDGETVPLLMTEERRAAARGERKTKYTSLREHYRDKYGGDGDF